MAGRQRYRRASRDREIAWLGQRRPHEGGEGTPQGGEGTSQGGESAPEGGGQGPEAASQRRAEGAANVNCTHAVDRIPSRDVALVHRQIRRADTRPEARL